MMDCWSQHPSRRPSFGSIRESLEDLMHDSNKKAYIDMSTFDIDDFAPYQAMVSARNNSSRAEDEGLQEGTGRSGGEGAAYFDHLQAESNPETGKPYFDHLHSKTGDKSGNGKPYFDHLHSKTNKGSENGKPYFDHLHQGSEAQGETPRAENGNEKQYFDHLTREPNNAAAGERYFDKLTVRNNESGSESRSLHLAIAGRPLSSLSQNAPLSPSSQVAVAGQSSHRSHHDNDDISICSQHIEELDTAL